jgi:hypothetical protein
MPISDEDLVRAFCGPLDRLPGFQCRIARTEGYVRFGIGGREGSVKAP